MILELSIYWIIDKILAKLVLISYGYSHRFQNDYTRITRSDCLIYSGVGKSSMLIRYLKGQFSEQYNVTVGVEFASKNIVVESNKEISLQIWDTVLYNLLYDRQVNKHLEQLFVRSIKEYQAYFWHLHLIIKIVYSS